MCFRLRLRAIVVTEAATETEERVHEFDCSSVLAVLDYLLSPH